MGDCHAVPFVCNQLKKFEGCIAHHGAVCGWCQARLVAAARKSKRGRAWEDFSAAELERAKEDSLLNRAAWVKRAAEEQGKKEAAEQAKMAKAEAIEKAKADKAAKEQKEQKEQANAAQEIQGKEYDAAETEAAEGEKEQTEQAVADQEIQGKGDAAETKAAVGSQQDREKETAEADEPAAKRRKV